MRATPASPWRAERSGKTNEITAIPELLDHLASTGQLKGAILTIDAMGCQVAMADKIVAHRADFVLALKGNHPSFEAEVASCFGLTALAS